MGLCNIDAHEWEIYSGKMIQTSAYLFFEWHSFHTNTRASGSVWFWPLVWQKFVKPISNTKWVISPLYLARKIYFLMTLWWYSVCTEPTRRVYFYCHITDTTIHRQTLGSTSSQQPVFALTHLCFMPIRWATDTNFLASGIGRLVHRKNVPYERRARYPLLHRCYVCSVLISFNQCGDMHGLHR